MSHSYYIGLDLGTSGLKAILVDERGKSIGSSRYGYKSSSPHIGWQEQHPKDWITACFSALGVLRKQFPREYNRVLGIGVSGHMHGAVLLDASNTIIRPCIMWNDTRSHKEASELDKKEIFRMVSGNIVFPGFTAPKLLWLARNEPENFRRVRTIMLPATYLNWWLTGICTGDYSDAAGTSWLDVAQRKWSLDLMQLTGIQESQLSNLMYGCQVIGSLRPKLARSLGLSHKILVVAGAGDNAAAACGVGVLNEGDGCISLGTSGTIVCAKEECVPDASSALHTFCHAIPNRWYQMGVILSATSALNWLSSLLNRTPQSLIHRLEQSSQSPSSVMFFPYLLGERTPHNNAHLRGGFVGLHEKTDPEEMTKAVLEGVSYALRDCFDLLKQTGVHPSSLWVIGGGAASERWCQILSNVLNVRIKRPEEGSHGAALGAARLAMIGVTQESIDSICYTPSLKDQFHPCEEVQEQYEKRHKYFQNYIRYLKQE